MTETGPVVPNRDARHDSRRTLWIALAFVALAVVVGLVFVANNNRAATLAAQQKAQAAQLADADSTAKAALVTATGATAVAQQSAQTAAQAAATAKTAAQSTASQDTTSQADQGSSSQTASSQTALSQVASTKGASSQGASSQSSSSQKGENKLALAQGKRALAASAADAAQAAAATSGDPRYTQAGGSIADRAVAAVGPGNLPVDQAQLAQTGQPFKQ